ncbi:hypothetical protein ACFX15_024873 [Malus domestica]
MITFSKIEVTLLPESREPDPHHDCFLKNRRCIVLRINRRDARFLKSWAAQRPRGPISEIEEAPTFLALSAPVTRTQLCGNYGHSVEDFSRAQTTFSKCSDRVKTCEAGSSHYRAMTKQGKGIALLLVVRKTPIYVDLHPQRTGRPAKMFNPSSYLRGHSQRSLSKYSAFFPPDNTFANKLY